MAKRLTEKQKEDIIKSFTSGKTIEFLSQKFNCNKLTIIRNLKKNIGESKYKEYIKKNKTSIEKIFSHENQSTENLDSELSLDSSVKNFPDNKNFQERSNEVDSFNVSPFMEISPVDIQIENSSRKELSSVSISDIDFPKTVYMIVDKKIELEIKLLRDFPEWSFLPIEDLKRKTIEIFFDIKVAKRFCNKEQKVIKVPNTDVFKVTAPLLISRGITRIVSAEKLIAL